MIVKRALENVWSPQLRNRRNVDIYLPASYRNKSVRFPVVYMHDGQNLSDPSTAFAGTWNLDETLDRLTPRAIEPIVVLCFGGIVALTLSRQFGPHPRLWQIAATLDSSNVASSDSRIRRCVKPLSHVLGVTKLTIPAPACSTQYCAQRRNLIESSARLLFRSPRPAR